MGPEVIQIATNEELEQAIVKAIEDEATRFSAIKKEVLLMLKDRGLTINEDNSPYFRQVDRALQRLRKRGTLEFGGKPSRWQAVPNIGKIDDEDTLPEGAIAKDATGCDV